MCFYYSTIGLHFSSIIDITAQLYVFVFVYVCVEQDEIYMCLLKLEDILFIIL